MHRKITQSNNINNTQDGRPQALKRPYPHLNGRNEKK